jgi:hypothetical protein
MAESTSEAGMKLIDEDGIPYYAHWSEEDGEWVGTCPFYPSLSWLDPKPSEALEGIKRLVADVREDIGDE